MMQAAPHTFSLKAAIEKARAAVLGQQSNPQTRSEAPTQAAPPASAAPVAAPVLPTVAYTRISLPSPVSIGPVLPSADAVTMLLELTPKAAAVFGLLHQIAAHVVREKGYSVAPSQVTVHLPASMLALGAGLSRATLYRHLPALVKAGLLAYGGQAQKVKGMGLYSGCLWAVKLTPGDHSPRLRREDWQTEQRDFAGDIAAGRTAAAFLEAVRQLHPEQRESAAHTALKTWALAPGTTKPRCAVVVSRPAANLREVIHALSALSSVHAAKRAEQVTILGERLARALNDDHSRRWYCGLLWAALDAENEGRHGLQVLGAALSRLSADRAEWQELKNPAALLAKRLAG